MCREGSKNRDDLGTIFTLCLSVEKRISHTEPLMGLQSVGGIVCVCVCALSVVQSGIAYKHRCYPVLSWKLTAAFPANILNYTVPATNPEIIEGKERSTIIQG